MFPSIYLEKEVGKKLGGGKILLQAMLRRGKIQKKSLAIGADIKCQPNEQRKEISQ